MKIKLNLLLYIPIIFLFLPAFAVKVPLLNTISLVFYIILYICIALLLLHDTKSFYQSILKLFRTSCLKYYLILLAYICINSIFLSFVGITNIKQSFHSIIMQIVLSIIPITFYFTYIIGKHISFEKFLKFFVLLIWIDLVIGLVSYIGQIGNIDFINKCFNFLANARTLKLQDNGLDVYFLTGNYADEFGFLRLDNLFEEPSYYARFIFLYLPFIYSFSINKLQLFQNVFFNKLFKVSFIPLAWINLFLTLSPIYLIFAFLISSIYFFSDIIRLIKKYFMLLSIFFLVILFVLLRIDFSNTFLIRIINVLSNIKSFDDFIRIEPSLGTRVVNYINSFCVFLKHPFTGVGIGNLGKVLIVQLQHSPVSLTGEIYKKLSVAISMNRPLNFNQGFIYYFLAENGVVAAGIFAYFYKKIFDRINSINKFLVLYKTSLNYCALRGIKFSLTAFIIQFFYGLMLSDIELQIILFIAITFIEYQKKIFNSQEYINAK